MALRSAAFVLGLAPRSGVYGVRALCTGGGRQKGPHRFSLRARKRHFVTTTASTAAADRRASTVPSPASQEKSVRDLREVLEGRLREAIVSAFGEEARDVDPMLTAATREEFGDYQCNAAMGLAKLNRTKPREVATKIVEALDIADICEDPQIAGPGFINLSLKTETLTNTLREMIRDIDRVGLPKRTNPQRIVVDFSSPNVAKEMHVGHLRSTIIGDSLARLLEFLGHDVLRLNHVGDWGTQFGMLIHYLKQTAPEVVGKEDLDLGDLVAFYKKAKVRFDEDDEFKDFARQEVVRLQAGDGDSLAAWKLLCAQSRREFEKIYQILNVQTDERGESFYNPFLPEVIEELQRKSLVVENEGAQVVFLEGFRNREGNPQPLIVQKSDGGYMYATTDLAAIRYRTSVDGAQRVLYVTDIGQCTHFEQVFQVAQRAGFVPPHVSLEHVPFGLVLGEDGKKFKTRSGETVKLKDLLSEAVVRAREDFVSRLETEGRQETENYIEHAARTIGIAAVKYADLKNSRVTNYRFSYEKMLALQGNTAPYMLYAYARIQGINRKIGAPESLDDVSLVLEDASERSLARHIVHLPEIVTELERDLKLHVLCEYIFELSQKFNQFYERCSIANAPSEELRRSRLGLATLTAGVLLFALRILGIEPLERL